MNNEETSFMDGPLSILLGSELDCDGYSVVNRCCEGHLITGQSVGPHIGYCSWTFANHGYPLECGRNDEVVAGRCGSGQCIAITCSVFLLLVF